MENVKPQREADDESSLNRRLASLLIYCYYMQQVGKKQLIAYRVALIYSLALGFIRVHNDVD